MKILKRNSGNFHVRLRRGLLRLCDDLICKSQTADTGAREVERQDRQVATEVRSPFLYEPLEPTVGPSEDGLPPLVELAFLLLAAHVTLIDVLDELRKVHGGKPLREVPHMGRD